MKKSLKICTALFGLASLIATTQTVLSQPAQAEQKYTIPSTPGAQAQGSMPAMQHTQGMTHSQGMTHTPGMKMPQINLGKMPKEAGQAAFATIAEIVAILNADPKTDWSKVNINALREHLVDMDEVTMRAKVSQQKSEHSVLFTITGKGRTLQAIQAMVIAHSFELNKIDGWKVAANKIPDGAVLIISSDNTTEITKINALGFFGVMSMGAHHQPHHFGMATGLMVHQH